MKKLFFILTFLVIFISLAANPVEVPLINELKFNYGGSWELELVPPYVTDFFNSAKIVFSSGESGFNIGSIEFLDEVCIITPDDLQNPIPLLRDGDFISCYYPIDNEYTLIDSVSFGNYEGSSVNSPYYNQSLTRVYPPFEEEEYWFVKNNNPDIGNWEELYVYHDGTLNGHVYGLNDQPVNNATIFVNSLNGQNYYSRMTNETGYFEMDMLYGRNYLINVDIAGVSYLDTLITIEPDSTTSLECHTGYASSHEDEIPIASKVALSSYPNPFYPHNTKSGAVTISFEINSKITPAIAIYNQKGQKVRTLYPLNKASSVIWDGKDKSGKFVKSGVYIYSLESGSKALKSNKIILINDK